MVGGVWVCGGVFGVCWCGVCVCAWALNTAQHSTSVVCGVFGVLVWGVVSVLMCAVFSAHAIVPMPWLCLVPMPWLCFMPMPCCDDESP